jgi:hypothetical protein
MVLLVVAGCGSTGSPSGSVPETRPSPSASFPVSRASQTPTPPYTLDIQTIPQSWTTPILGATTDGSEIIWSKGGDTVEGAPDLYSFAPGASAPTLIYRSPNRTSQLMPIAVSHGKYAFEEGFANTDRTGGWRLWLVPSAGASAQLIDSSAKDPHGMPTPVVWISLTKDRLIWSCVHQTQSGPAFYLRSYEFKTSTIRDLIAVDPATTEVWYPNADDQGRLIYSTVEYSPNGNVSYHVYFWQITAGAFQPRRLDSDGTSTEPVLSLDTVVWKSVSGDNVSNAGLLTRYSLAAGTSSQLTLTGLSTFNDETAGNRYVAAWEDHTLFELYDLQTDSTLVVEKHAATAAEGVVHQSLAGDMVVFVRILDPSNTNLQLCWLRLPPLSGT